MKNEERTEAVVPAVDPTQDVDIKRLRRGRYGAENNSGDRYFYNVHSNSLGAADGWAQNTSWGNRSLVVEDGNKKSEGQGGKASC